MTDYKNVIIFIIYFLFSSFLYCSPLLIKNGYIDLTDNDFTNKIVLKGEYKFKYQDKELLINVPGYWNKTINKGYGYCEYFLKLKIPVNRNLYLFMDHISTAYELYINNNLALKAGRIGKDKNESIPELKYAYISLPATNVIQLHWKISNFHSNVGGIPYAPIIGTRNFIKNRFNLNLFLSLLFIGIMLMLTLYHFIFWFLRKAEKASLILAMSTFVISLRIFTANFVTAFFFNPSTLKYLIEIKITYITGILGFGFISLFIVYIYPYKYNRIIIKILFWIGSFISLLFLFLNPIIINKFLIPLNILLILVGIVNITTLLAYIKKEIDAILLLLGFLFMYLACIHDMVYAIGLIYSINISYIGLTILFIFQAIILAKRFTKAFKTVEQLSTNLEKKVQQRTQELQAANIKIQEQSAQRTAFFINVTHETKTPLTLIQTNFDEYLKSLKNKITPRLKNIKFYISKLCRDITNLLDSEKIRRGSEFYDHSRLVNISTILNQEIKLFKTVINKKGITLTSSCKDSLFCKIDPAAFERIINNLLDNAIKYIGEGNLIDITLTSDKTNIFLTIQDNGIGISEEQQKNIFLPDFQISKEKSNIQGLGLGLSIVKHIVDSVSGNIKIESEINKGTKITIILSKYNVTEIDIITDYIPAEPITGIINEKPVEESYDENKYTVFFIEDKIELITAMQKSMSPFFNFYYALDGQEALEKLERIHKPDIIISDIMMDKMDGHEFYDELKKQERFKDIPFLFLTARTMQQEKEESLDKGILDYIYKPFKMDELIKRVLALLKYRQTLIESEREKMEGKIVSLLRSNKDIKFLKFEQKCKEYDLSPREKDVVRLILQVLPQKQIADKLNLSNSTISKHIYQIYKKCNVHTNMELLKLFLE